MANNISKPSRTVSDLLPSNLQTNLLTKIFSSTVDQMFKVERSEKFAGFIGNLPPYGSEDDIYLKEMNQTRQDHQLEPGVATYKNGDVDTAITYDDFLDYLRFNGADTTNPSKMFAQTYFTWAPPINLDMLVNYTNYYWLPSGPPAVTILATRVAVVTFKVTADAVIRITDKTDPSKFVEIPSTQLLDRENLFSIPNHPFYDYELVNVSLVSGTLPDGLSTTDDYYVKDIANNKIGLGNAQTSAKIDVTKDIIGQKTYTSPNNVTLSSGMKIRFDGLNIPQEYLNTSYIVEGVGRSIKLIDVADLDLPQTYNDDTQDYIVMERDAADLNAWARANNWYHKDVITLQDVEPQGISAWDGDPYDTVAWDFDPGATITPATLTSVTQAKRPIISFDANLEKYKSGTTMKAKVDLVDTTTTNIVSQIVGRKIYTIEGVKLIEGMNVLFTNESNNTKNNRIYKVLYTNKVYARGQLTDYRIDLQEVNITTNAFGKRVATPEIGDIILVTNGAQHIGQSLYWTGSQWAKAVDKKTPNQNILFDYYDYKGVKLDDPTKYPSSTFVGGSIFAYSEQKVGPLDKYLNKRLVFKGLGQLSDISFDNDLDTHTIEYADKNGLTALFNGLKYFKRTTGEISNGWLKVDYPSVIQIKDRFVFDTDKTFTMSIVGSDETEVLVNNTPIRGFTFNGKAVTITDGMNKGDVIETLNPYNGEKDVTGKLSLPINLTSNPLNEEVTQITRSDYLRHFSHILSKIDGFDGKPAGTNNYRDTDRKITKGGTIFQHTAPLVKPMGLASVEHLNPVKAVRYSETEYTRIKNKLLNKVTRYLQDVNTNKNVTAGELLDKFLTEINNGKTASSAFYDSRMLPTGNDYNTETQRTSSGHALTIPDIDTAKYSFKVVSIYFKDRILTKNKDYIIDDNGDYFITASDIPDGSSVDVRVYFNAGQSYVPATPACLGLAEIYIPREYVDTTYVTPTPVIQGHDGSIQMATGDLRDKIILEFESRIYNSIAPEVFDTPVTPTIQNDIDGFFRKGLYTTDEYKNVFNRQVNLWATRNSIDLFTNSFYDSTEPKTWNYRNAAVLSDVNSGKFTTDHHLGSWRTIFNWFYDTDRPDTHPWEMLGFSIKPTWWENEYGKEPYTSGNKLLWNDIERGIIRYGNRAGVDKDYVRPGLSKILPVDRLGDVRHLEDIGLIKSNKFVGKDSEWHIGDLGPAETAWKRSSDARFADLISLIVMRPVEGLELGWNPFVYRTFNGQLVNEHTGTRGIDRDSLMHREKDEHTKGLCHIISNYVIHQGKDITTEMGDLVRSVQVQMMHRFGAFIKQETLRVEMETLSTKSSRKQNKIPDEDLNIKIYESTPKKEIFYGGIIVERLKSGYKVYGYDTINPEFNIIPSVKVGSKVTVSVGNYNVIKYHQGSNDIIQVPYGTEFADVQEVYDFIISYGRYLEHVGFEFSQVDTTTNEILDWSFSGREFLFWASEKWVNGTFIALSPSANGVQFKSEFGTIKNVEQIIQGTYAILDRSGAAIRPDDLDVVRQNGVLEATPTSNQGIYGLRLFVTYIEHIVILNNKTRFNDIIFDSLYALYVPRLRASGIKLSDWQGRLEAYGYIIDPTNNILYSNFDKLAEDFRAVHDTTSVGVRDTTDQLAKSMIGFVEEGYLSNLNMSREQQFEFYKGLIKNKGTVAAINALNRSTVINNTDDINVSEEWAILDSEFGGSRRQEYIEFDFTADVVTGTNETVNFVIQHDDKYDIDFNGSFAPNRSPVVYDSNDYNIIDTVDKNGKLIKFSDSWISPKLSEGNIFETRYNDTPDKYFAYAGYPKFEYINYTAFNVDEILDKHNATSSAVEGDLLWIAHDQDRSRKWQRGWNVRRLENLHVRAQQRDDNSIKILHSNNITEGDLLLLKQPNSAGIPLKVKFLDRDTDEKEIFINVDTPSGEKPLMDIKSCDHVYINSINLDITEAFDGTVPSIPHISVYDSNGEIASKDNPITLNGSNSFELNTTGLFEFFVDKHVPSDTQLIVDFYGSSRFIPNNMIEHTVKTNQTQYAMPEMWAPGTNMRFSVNISNNQPLRDWEYYVENYSLILAKYNYSLVGKTPAPTINEAIVIDFADGYTQLYPENYRIKDIADNLQKNYNIYYQNNDILLKTNNKLTPKVYKAKVTAKSNNHEYDVTSIDTAIAVTYQRSGNVTARRYLREAYPCNHVIDTNINPDTELTTQNGYTVDELVLIYNQTVPQTNGLYRVTGATPIRDRVASGFASTTYFVDVTNKQVYRMNKFGGTDVNIQKRGFYLYTHGATKFEVIIDPSIAYTHVLTTPLIKEKAINYSFVETENQFPQNGPLRIKIDESTYTGSTKSKGYATIKVNYEMANVVGTNDTSGLSEKQAYDVYAWKSSRFADLNDSTKIAATSSRLVDSVSPRDSLIIDGKRISFNEIGTTITLPKKNPTLRLRDSITFDVGTSTAVTAGKIPVAFNTMVIPNVKIPQTIEDGALIGLTSYDNTNTKIKTNYFEMHYVLRGTVDLHDPQQVAALTGHITIEAPSGNVILSNFDLSGHQNIAQLVSSINNALIGSIQTQTIHAEQGWVNGKAHVYFIAKNNSFAIPLDGIHASGDIASLGLPHSTTQINFGDFEFLFSRPQEYINKGTASNPNYVLEFTNDALTNKLVPNTDGITFDWYLNSISSSNKHAFSYEFDFPDNTMFAAFGVQQNKHYSTVPNNVIVDTINRVLRATPISNVPNSSTVAILNPVEVANNHIVIHWFNSNTTPYVSKAIVKTQHISLEMTKSVAVSLGLANQSDSWTTMNKVFDYSKVSLLQISNAINTGMSEFVVSSLYHPSSTRGSMTIDTDGNLLYTVNNTHIGNLPADTSVQETYTVRNVTGKVFDVRVNLNQSNSAPDNNSGNGSNILSLTFNPSLAPNTNVQARGKLHNESFVVARLETETANNSVLSQRIVIEKTILDNQNNLLFPGVLPILTFDGKVSELLDLRDTSGPIPNNGYTNGLMVFIDTREQVFKYENKQWVTVSQLTPTSDTSNIEKVQIYDRKISEVIDVMTFFDPVKDHLPAIATKEIKYRLSYDPAKYSVRDSVLINDLSNWGESHVGEAWWDISNVAYPRYDTTDIEYNKIYWGKPFPGSDISVVEWTKSNHPPYAWDAHIAESELSADTLGTPYNAESWSEQDEAQPNGTFKTVYYFWVRKCKVTPNKHSRALSVDEVEFILMNPSKYGLKWYASLGPNTIYFNNLSHINQETAVQIHFKPSTAQRHTQWELIREQDGSKPIRSKHWQKLIDSLVGFDKSGRKVPDMTLPEKLRLGNGLRPRQSWFKDIRTAREVAFKYINQQLETKDVVDNSHFKTALQNLTKTDKPVFAANSITSGVINDFDVVTNGNVRFGIDSSLMLLSPTIVKQTGTNKSGTPFTTVSGITSFVVNGYGIDVPDGATLSKMPQLFNDIKSHTKIETTLLRRNNNYYLIIDADTPAIDLQQVSQNNVATLLGINFGSYNTVSTLGTVVNPSVQANDSFMFNGRLVKFENDINGNAAQIVNEINKQATSIPITNNLPNNLSTYAGATFIIEAKNGTHGIVSNFDNFNTLKTHGATVTGVTGVNVVLTSDNKLAVLSSIGPVRIRADRNIPLSNQAAHAIGLNEHWTDSSGSPYVAFQLANKVGFKYNGIYIADINTNEWQGLEGFNTHTSAIGIINTINNAHIPHVTAKYVSGGKFSITNNEGKSIGLISQSRVGSKGIIEYFGLKPGSISGSYPVKTIPTKYDLTFVTGVTIGDNVLIEHDSDLGGRWSVYTKTKDGWDYFASQQVSASDFWTYSDWFKEGVDPTVKANRIVTSIAKLNNLIPEYTGEIVRLTDTNNKWRLYQENNGRFEVIAKQDATIKFNEQRIVEHAKNAEVDYLLRDIKTLFLNPDEQKSWFFVLINHVFVEQPYVEWIFKTSYIQIGGFKDKNSSGSLFKSDSVDDFLGFVADAKPYRTKIRDYTKQRALDIDEANVHATDFDNPVYYNSQTKKYQPVRRDNSRIVGKTPWKDWFEMLSFDDTLYKVGLGPANYKNRVRKVKASLKFDNYSDFTTKDLEGAAKRIHDDYKPGVGLPAPEATIRTGYRGMTVDGSRLSFGTGWDTMSWNFLGWDVQPDTLEDYFLMTAVDGQVPVFVRSYANYVEYTSDGQTTVFVAPSHITIDKHTVIKVGGKTLSSRLYTIDQNRIIINRAEVQSRITVNKPTDVIIKSSPRNREFFINGVAFNINRSTNYTFQNIIDMVNAETPKTKVHADSILENRRYRMVLSTTRKTEVEPLTIHLKDSALLDPVLNEFGFVQGDYLSPNLGEKITIRGTFTPYIKTPDKGRKGSGYRVAFDGRWLKEGVEYTVQNEGIVLNLPPNIVYTDTSTIAVATKETFTIPTQTANHFDFDGGKYVDPHIQGYPEQLYPVHMRDTVTATVQTCGVAVQSSIDITSIVPGDIDINGVPIRIDASDTVESIVGKINAANLGVLASVVN